MADAPDESGSEVVSSSSPPPAAAAAAGTPAAPAAAVPTAEELATTQRVLAALAADPELLASKAAQGIRRALVPLYEWHASRTFGGKGVGAYSDDKATKLRNSLEAHRRKQLDAKHVAATRLRASRMERLAELAEVAGPSVPLIPDGAVDTADLTTIVHDGTPRLLVGDAPVAAVAAAAEVAGAGAAMVPEVEAPVAADAAAAAAETAAEAAAAAATAASPTPAAAGSEDAAATPTGEGGDGVQLHRSRSCYICKSPFTTLHHFYDRLCPFCASVNWAKRNLVVDLRGRVALVTGARVKIGFQAVLKLLRCGASVIATTRFPHDAADRFAALPDFGLWRDRLHVYGVDFRNLPVLEAFCDMVGREYTRLDMIINNACQTVRRPPAFYSHLMSKETTPLGRLADAVQPLLRRDHAFHTNVRLLTAPVPRGVGDGDGGGGGGGGDDGDDGVEVDAADAPAPAATAAAAAAATRSAAMSQLVVVAGDDLHDTTHFPSGVTDVNAQQLDLRTHNSWLLKMEEVSTPELAEVFAINAMAPFIMNARLKPLMLRGRGDLPDEPLAHFAAEHRGRAAAASSSSGAPADSGGSFSTLADALARAAAAAEGGGGGGGSSSSGADGRAPTAGAKRARRGPATPASPSALLGGAAPPVPAAACRFIVNVSAMAGKFYRHKVPTHPPPNVGRAALNVRPPTSPGHYAKQPVSVTAGDTGRRT